MSFLLLFKNEKFPYPGSVVSNDGHSLEVGYLQVCGSVNLH